MKKFLYLYISICISFYCINNLIASERVRAQDFQKLKANIEDNDIAQARILLEKYVNDKHEFAFIDAPYVTNELVHKIKSIEMARLFLQYGIDPNTCNRFQENLVHIAVKATNIPFIEELIAISVNLNQKDYWSKTPLDQARNHANSPINPVYRKQYYKISDILQAAGAHSSVSLNPMPNDETMERELQRAIEQYNREKALRWRKIKK